MNNIAVIQARMGSSRFPGKMLSDLCGRPVLGWVVRAAHAIPGIAKVVVATSDARGDDAIGDWCKNNSITCYRGSEEDVLARFWLAATSENADLIMRITGDCPLLDPQVAGSVLMLCTRSGADYVSNIEPRSWPDGLDCEVFTIKALEQACVEAKSPYEREHVTPFIRRNAGQFRRENFPCPVSMPDEQWTLDHYEDLAFLGEVLKRLPENNPPSYLEVLQVLDENPELRQINARVGRNVSAASGEDIAGYGHQRSLTLFDRAIKTIPLASQTFSKSYLQYPKGKSPLFLVQGSGGRVWDEDGNEYVDLVCGLLSVLLGYRDEDVDGAIKSQLSKGISFSLPSRLEMELSERLVDLIPCAEKVRFGKNGSDATAASIRLARAYTGRKRIAVCGYHGWQDWYIATTTRDKGIPPEVGALSHTFVYNDLKSLKRLLSEHPNEFAAVIMEPCNVVEPLPGYLQSVKELAHRHGALLVFDEIIMGLRISMGGAQEYYNVVPDLACFGKGMGNGMPISAVVGRADVMDEMDEIFFSGTFGGEALSIAAAIAVIDKMLREPVVEQLWKTGTVLRDGISSLAASSGLQDCVSLGGLPPWSFTMFHDHETANAAEIKTYWMQEMIRAGVLTIGTHNVCYAHNEVDIKHVLSAYERAFAGIAEHLGRGNLPKLLEGNVVQPIFKVR